MLLRRGRPADTSSTAARSAPPLEARMDEPAASFGEWLRRRRKALDLTQEALAQRAGYSLGGDPQAGR